MPLRVSGMNSGMDTDTIIRDLVKSKQVKIDEIKKKQTALKWKQEEWKSINSEIVKFKNESLSKLRDASLFSKMKTTTTDEDTLSVSGSVGATEGVQSAYVESVAKSGYLTGGEIRLNDGTYANSSSKISEIKGMEGITGSFAISTHGVPVEITVDENTTIASLEKQLSRAGIKANYDEANGRFFLSAKKTGSENDFKLETTGSNSLLLMNGLGLSESKRGSRIDGEDAVLVLNGARFTSQNNTFVVNDMTFEAKKASKLNEAGTGYEEMNIQTAVDVDGIYDTIVDLVKEYNELIGKMDKLYKADSAGSYEPLTDEEKESISESEGEAIEKKVRESLLRSDSTLGGVIEAMHSAMTGAIEIGGNKDSKGVTIPGTGERMFLSDFGIATKPYLSAGKYEKHVFEIAGETGNVAANANKLKEMITSNPEKTSDFFSQLFSGLYNDLGNKMSSVREFRSFDHVYNDKAMQTQYDNYTREIEDAEKALGEYEDKWYDQFTAMEVALANINSKQSAISGMLGM